MDPSRPPVIVLGGDSNALSIARSLGRAGVEVHGIGVPSFIGRSRYLNPIAVPAGEPEETWAEVLLGPATEHLHGAVVLAASDVGLTVLLDHRDELLRRYVLDISDVTAQRALLDKLSTYELARKAGVPTPKFWRIDTAADLEAHTADYVYPMIVKPLLSHLYQAMFPGLSKFRIVADEAELRRHHGELTERGLAVMLVEQIPGSDEQLCSYYTYLDESGSPCFDFTKRVIRRNPPGMGVGSHHATDWNPEVKDVSLRLFKHVGLRGLANAEFIRDTRDGTLKLIECNARFTAANPLVAAAGLDLAQFVYRRLVGDPITLPGTYRRGLHLLYPSNDFRAYRALAARGELGFVGWLRSLAAPQTFAYFAGDDPLPAVARALHRSGVAVRRARERILTRAG